MTVIVAGPIMVASAPAAVVRAPLRIDLLKLTSPRACTALASDEIVVCAPRARDPDRLEPTPDVAQTSLPKAEFKLLGQSRIAAKVDSEDFGRDVSNRALVTLKIPF